MQLAGKENRSTRIVFLTASLTIEPTIAAVEGGAWGIVLNEAAADTLVQCLTQLALSAGAEEASSAMSATRVLERP